MAKAHQVNWDIRRQGRVWQKEAMQRWELTPEKIEMVRGQLFYTDEQRLAMLGMLLENLGADAAVRLGDAEIWRQAVAALPQRRSMKSSLAKRPRSK
jgi:hypothetical protein